MEGVLVEPLAESALIDRLLADGELSAQTAPISQPGAPGPCANAQTGTSGVIFAFERGGAVGVGVAGLVRMAPAAGIDDHG
jgi:hypothetical protein